MNVLIILGEKLNKNGLMNDNLIYRLKKGYELYNKNKYNYIILCGGIVEKKVKYSESFVMKNYLINKNIPKNILIEENHSTSTIENSIESLKILNKLKNIHEVNILSSEYHINRVKIIFEKIYKNKYNLIFISSKNGISGKKLENIIKNEAKYINIFLNY